MRTAVWLAVLTLAFPLAAADDPAAVTGRRGGRAITYAGRLGTTAEGLLVALVGSCATEAQPAPAAAWAAALQADHLRVKYARPRVLASCVEGDKLTVDEIVFVVSPAHQRHGFLVRSGSHYFAFAKYDPHIWMVVQKRVLGE